MEKLNTNLEKLNEFPLLKYLPEKSVHCLTKNGKLITLQPDELLFQEGSKQCSMFLILEGELEIFIDSILIAVRGPGEYIGEMSMIDPKIRSASVRSTCKTDLFEIDKGMLDSCLATNSTVVMEILKTVTNRSREDLAVLKQNNKELHEFTQIASHDLQEPLRKIMTFGERLKEKAVNLDKESLDCIERMQKSTIRMKCYIDDLLDYAKIEAKHTLFEKVDLQKKVKTVCEEL